MFLLFANPIMGSSSSQASSLEIVDTIKLDRVPYSIAVNEETNRIYIGVNDSTIVIDGTTKQILTTIPSNHSVSQIVVDSKNNKAIAVSDVWDDVWIIDGATDSIIGELPLSANDDPISVAVDSERNLIYVGIQEDTYFNVNDRIEGYDENTLNYLDWIPISGSASRSFHSVYVAVDTRLNRIYATWSGNNTLYLFDGTTRQLLKTGQYISPYKIILGVDPSTNRVYMTNETLDGDSLERIPQFSLWNVPEALAFDPYYNLVYVIRDRTNGSYASSSPYDLLIADTNANVFATLSLGNRLGYRPQMAVNTKTGDIYLTNSNENEILVVKGPNPERPILTTDLSVYPQRVETGQPVTISFTVRNLGNNSAAYTPLIEVGDSVLPQQEIQLGSREVRTLAITTNQSGGTYIVKVEGLLANFTVQYGPHSLISILSPENTTYATTVVPLTVIVNKTTSWIGCSLDRLINWTITGNTTRVCLDGRHRLDIYANDTFGNIGSDTVLFTVDTTPPNITAISQNPLTSNIQPTDEVKANATITDALCEIEQVTLNYTYTNSTGAWTNVVGMTNLEGNIWSTTIPAFRWGTNVTYRIIATDSAGNTINSESLGYERRYQVVPEFPSLLFLFLFIVPTALVLIAYKRKHVL